MARFNGGWIKLWRRAVEGDLADNVFLWGLWNWLLYAAHWKPSSIIWKGERRDIPAGTVVLGMTELAEKWECSRTTVKKWLVYLENSGRISLEVCQRGTLVTILNWDTYQSPFAERCESSDNEVSAECPQGDNEVALIEESKKEERKKEYIGAVKKNSDLVATPKPLTQEELTECYEAWLETLRHFKAGRKNILAAEQTEIVRAAQRFGSAKAVAMAIEGARHEPKGDKFNPADFLRLSRILHVDNFNRFLNLGVQAVNKRTVG